MQAQPKFILTSKHREICYLLHTHSGIYSVFKNKPCMLARHGGTCVLNPRTQQPRVRGFQAKKQFIP